MPVPFDLCASSPVTHICGWPVIFLLYGISSPGEELTGALAGAITCLGPQAGMRPLHSREGVLENHGKPLPCSWSVGAWGGMSSWCPLLLFILAMQPLSLPFLQPKSRHPLCFCGKLCCNALVNEEGDSY